MIFISSSFPEICKYMSLLISSFSSLEADAEKSLKLIAISTTSVNKLHFPFHGDPIISSPDPFFLLDLKGSWFISNSHAIFLSFSTFNFLIIFFTLLTSFSHLSASLYLMFYPVHFLLSWFLLVFDFSTLIIFILTKTIFISRWYAKTLNII